jgi:transposase
MVLLRMGLPKGQPVDFEQLEERRLQAAQLFAQGLAQAEVSRRLGVKPASVCRWHKSWKEGGEEALRQQAAAGRKARLEPAQLKQLETELLQGPLAHGYRSDLWTLERVGLLIRKLFGVRYHRGHVWKLLRKLGWSAQRPTTRARERDEGAVAQWRRRRWPAKKGRHQAGAMDCPLGRKRVLGAA